MPEPIPFDSVEQLVVDWPEPPKRYNPKKEILPLINAGAIHSYYISGDLVFLDSKNKKFKPDRKAKYYYPSSECILLFDADNNMAIMRFDGKVVTDYIYQAICDDDFPSNPSINGCVQVKAYNDEHTYYGLVDIRTGKEIVKPEYTRMERFEDCILACKNEQYMLIDYEGTVFYAFEKGLKVNLSSSSSSSFDEDARYSLKIDDNKLYRNHSKDSCFLGSVGPYYLMRRYSSESWPESTESVYDENGKHLLTRAECWNHFYDGENFILPNQNWITVLKKNGEIIEIPFFDDIRTISKAEYQDNHLAYNDSSRGFRVTIDKDGHEISRAAIESEKEKRPEYLENFSESTIEQYDSIYPIWNNDHFMIASKGESRDRKEDIYNRSGELLLENAYGYISEITRENQMVVYTGENACYLLHTDGRYEPISGVKGVSKYAGG